MPGAGAWAGAGAERRPGLPSFFRVKRLPHQKCSAPLAQGKMSKQVASWGKRLGQTVGKETIAYAFRARE